MSEIDKSLLPDFILETREHLDEMESILLQLVGDRNNLELLNDLFRPVHTIKGGAQYIGLDKIYQLTHRLEKLLDLLCAGKEKSSSKIVETFIAARDCLLRLVEELGDCGREMTNIDNLIEILNGFTRVEIDANDEIAADSQEEDDVPVSWGVYDEEGDEELFSIFLTHLLENCAELFSLSHELPRSDQQITLLNYALELIGTLRSSANYMDYEELVKNYQEWLTQIELAIDSLIRGDIPSFEFMTHNIKAMKGSFPQLADIADDLPDQIHVPSTEPAGDDVTDAVMQAFAGMEQEETSGTDSSLSTEEILSHHEADDGSDAVVQASDRMDQDKAQAPLIDRVDSESDATSEIDLSLLPDFIIEAEEHLEEMESMLLRLVQEPDNTDLLNDIFRPIHTIKGGAQYIGLDQVSRLAHRLEDLLDLLREGKKPSSAEIVDTLIAARDRIVLLVKELSTTSCEQSSVDDLVVALTKMIGGDDGDDFDAEPDSPEREAVAAGGAYEEEEDKELYAIFLDHLKDNYSELTSIASNLPHATDKITEVNRALEIVEALRSSANYMDYVDLVQRYRIWSNELSQAAGLLACGDTPNLDFIEKNLAELQRMFPLLSNVIPEVDSGKDHGQIKVVVNEPVAGGLEETLIQKGASPLTSSESAQPDAKLFDNLANALDVSMSSSSDDDDYQNLQQIFEELVSEGGAQTAQPKKGIPDVAKHAGQSEAMKAGKARKARQIESKIKKSVRVDADKIDALMNQVGELVVDRSYFFQLFNEMRNLQRHLKETLGLEQKEVKLIRAFTYRLSEAIAALGRTSNELQEGVMKMRMLPISQIFNRYPRLVHDLTRNSDKQVNLVVRGEDTELDRMIVEELSDPLIHIIRNAIDHGIESTAERVSAGKSEKGTLILEAYQESNHIVIEVTDDGCGIDPENIRKKALEKGLFGYEELERLNADELISLILTAGFSTAEKVTGTSGRGVGMDVVKKNIEKLNGTLEIDSKKGVGTQMRLRIPLTLAIIHALMVRVSGDLFTIPLANVDETVRIFKDDTSIVEGVEVIHLRGQTLPIFRLSTLFNNIKEAQPSEKSFVVIVSVGGQRTGFVVDELLGQEEVVIKPLADYVQEKSGFSGATIIGDGRISLILDVYELVRMTTGKQAKKHQQQTEELKSRIRRRDNKEQQET